MKYAQIKAYIHKKKTASSDRLPWEAMSVLYSEAVSRGLSEASEGPALRAAEEQVTEWREKMRVWKRVTTAAGAGEAAWNMRNCSCRSGKLVSFSFPFLMSRCHACASWPVARPHSPVLEMAFSFGPHGRRVGLVSEGSTMDTQGPLPALDPGFEPLTPKEHI